MKYARGAKKSKKMKNYDLDSSEKNSVSSDFINDPLATKTTVAHKKSNIGTSDAISLSQASQPHQKKVKNLKFSSKKIRSTRTPLRMTPTRRAFNFKKKQQEAVLVKRYTQEASKEDSTNPRFGSEKGPKTKTRESRKEFLARNQSSLSNKMHFQGKANRSMNIIDSPTKPISKEKIASPRNIGSTLRQSVQMMNIVRSGKKAATMQDVEKRSIDESQSQNTPNPGYAGKIRKFGGPGFYGQYTSGIRKHKLDGASSKKRAVTPGKMQKSAY